MRSPTFRVAVAIACALAASTSAFAAGSAPSGRYAGTAKPFEGTGGPHKVSFAIKNGAMKNLVITAGTTRCNSISPGVADYTGQMPKLSGFPRYKLLRFAGSYEIEVTFRRDTPSAKWARNTQTFMEHGPFYVQILANFRHGKFVPSTTSVANVQIQFAASPTVQGWTSTGADTCYASGLLTASHKK